jgi:hypothetical protein
MRLILKAIGFCAALLVVAALVFILAKSTMETEAGSRTESFSQFINRVDTDMVKEVNYTGGNEIAYITKDGERFVTMAPPPAFAYVGLTERLLDRGIVIKAKQQR